MIVPWLTKIAITKTCKSNAFMKSLSLQKRRSKVAFLIRTFIFFSVIFIFFIKFYLTKNYTNREFVNSFTTNYGRVLLSVPAESESTNYNATAHSIKLQQNCTASAINEFPPDGLTRLQRQNGWIIIHVIIAFYCFWFLAAICDDYFVPAIEQICSKLQLQKDVIGATLMAAATSSPGLFMNCIGTFVTKGDIGVGTIVGSAVFNVLAVPACCGFFVRKAVHLDWWPVTRDCLMYCIAVLALLGILNDGKIMWYEALYLVIGYFFYMAAMYYNNKMARSARKLIMKYRRKAHTHQYHEVSEITPLLLGGSAHKNHYISNNNLENFKLSQQDLQLVEKAQQKTLSLESACSEDSMSSTESDYADDPWQRQSRSVLEFLLRWPITLILWLTIPDSRLRPNFKYLTFFLSIIWIGAISYLVAYVITIIGDTLDIPDSILGLTILSAGMSVPEAVSSIIVTKQGQGAMGISNSIGSNTFDILLCLGLPWLIKAYFLPENANESWVMLNSAGLSYAIIILLTTLFGLYIAFMANRFVLDRKIGIACSIMYVSFMLIASLIELNVFFEINLPVCNK